MANWHSFHIHFNHEADVFLKECLPTQLEQMRENGLVKRAFFIRYSEGGYHIRLRLSGSEEHLLEHRLQLIARNFNRTHTGAIDRIERAPYNRADHYFGNNPSTVYAELLNEATSQISLDLLSSKGNDQRAQRLMSALLSVDYLLERTCCSGDHRRTMITESRHFARRMCLKLVPNQEPVKAEGPRAQAIHQQITHVRETFFRTFDSRPSYRQAVRLGKRLLRRKQGEPFVFTHALHLLCNKLGLGFSDEYFMFSLIEEAV